MVSPTPGPWVENALHDGLGWRVESDAAGYPNDGWCVCSELIGPDAAANARLVAAAPELLAALEDILVHPRTDDRSIVFMPSSVAKARAAIAKAKGSA